MSQPYIGQIMIFGGSFAPQGWAFCNGQTMDISQNDTLFNLIGTTYGGDGRTTFNLPDLQGRVPVHIGQGPGLSNYNIGDKAGVESVTLTTPQLPAHNHQVAVVTGTTQGNTSTPGFQSNSVLADEFQSQANAAFAYVANNGTNQVALGTKTIGLTGGSQPHENRQPFLAINYIISLFGVFPSQ
jgi:microcystin-dependent protein